MPDLLHLTTDQWIALWTGLVTLLLGIAALAGTVAAIVLTIQANRRESRRDRQQDRDRVDRWLAEFLVEAGRFVARCEEWLALQDAFEERRMMHAFVSEAHLPGREPDGGELQALLDAARLVTRGSDADPLKEAAEVLARVLDNPMVERAAGVREIVIAVRYWRTMPPPRSVNLTRVTVVRG